MSAGEAENGKPSIALIGKTAVMRLRVLGGKETLDSLGGANHLSWATRMAKPRHHAELLILF